MWSNTRFNYFFKYTMIKLKKITEMLDREMKTVASAEETIEVVQ